MMTFLNATRDDVLRLKADGSRIIKWSIDGSFGAHKDLKGQTGGAMTLGRGSIQNVSSKQKVNTRRSTERELVLLDDVVPEILWTKLFLDEQGYDIKENLIYGGKQKLDEIGNQWKGKLDKENSILQYKIFLYYGPYQERRGID
jgi:hypothetical protein